MTPDQNKINSLINELVECLVKEASYKDAFKSIIEVTKEDYEDFDVSILAAAAKKKYKQIYHRDSYEKEKAKVEAVYEIVEELGD